MHRYGDGKRNDGGRSHREIPPAPAGGRHERRQARFASATRRSENRSVELAGRLFAPELAITLRNLRIADRKSTRLNSSHANISYAVFCLKKKKIEESERSV